jgi:D-alanyl-D-alanine carboxypeptidase
MVICKITRLIKYPDMELRNLKITPAEFYPLNVFLKKIIRLRTVKVAIQFLSTGPVLLPYLLLVGCEKLEVMVNPEVNHSTTKLVDQVTAGLISDILYNEINANELLGLQISLVDSAGETWTFSAGTIDIKRKELLRDEHVFRIGSVSKIYTSTIILSLVQNGVLDLDQIISDCFPGFPNASRITIRNLLNHSSGIRDIFSLPDVFIESSYLPDKIWNHREVAETCLKSKLLFDPGTETHYSSANFILAAIIAEKASGKKILDLYHEIIFNPYELENTLFVPYENDHAMMINGYVHHFALSMSEWYTHTPDHTSWSTAAHASGAITANSIDLSWFTHNLFHGNIVSKESLNEMTSCVGNKGLGLFEFRVNGRLHWGHEGEIMGFEAITAYSLERKITISICCNTTPYYIYQLLDMIGIINYEAPS